MSAYERRKKRATKKRVRGKPKAPAKKKKLTRKPKIAAKRVAARKKVAKRPKVAVRRRTAAKKKSASKKPRVTAKKKARTAAKAPAKAKRKKIAVRAKAKAKTLKKSTAKKRKVAVRAKAKTKASPKKPHKPSAREVARLRARNRKLTATLRRKLLELEKARQRVRLKKNVGRKRELKKKLTAKKRSITETRKEIKPTKLFGAPKAEKTKRLKDRFRELFIKAKRTNQLPKNKDRRRVVRTDKIRGEQRFVYVNRVLHPETVEEVLYKVRKAASTIKSTFPLWFSLLVFSAMGERLIGYGQRVLDSNDEDAGLFQTEGIDSTGAFPTFEGMMHSLEAKLEDYAGERSTVVFLHYIKLSHFDRVS